MAYLALHIDRSIPRDELCEAVWPDHEPELARSSLRTAVFSLRKQLEEVDPTTVAIDSDRTHVWLNAGSVRSDYSQFVSAVRSLEKSPGVQSERLALGFVRGPLLLGFSETWATPHQLAFEDMYSNLVVGLISRIESGFPVEEAVALGRTALTVAPYREDIHIALIKALNRAGRGAEAIRQFEMLEKLLDEQWGEAPSAHAVSALETTQELASSEPQVAETPKPAAVAGPARGTVPALNRRMFGRDSEVSRLATALDPGSDDVSRLWTVVGPGGCGKTVLSVLVARVLDERFDGRVAFVDLGSLRDANLLWAKVADTLRLSSPGADDAIDRLIEALSSGPTLVILDNAEHLSASVADIADHLLDRCQHLRILVTSRRLLGLARERAFTVSTLAAPSTSQDLASIAQSPSVMLYLDRARAIRPDFELTPNNVSAIVEICRRLEGLPLAIELAAAQNSVMSPAQLLLRFGEHSLRFKNKLRDAEDRHRSLEGVLDWSYGLLSESEQSAFRALGVFCDSFSFEAGQAVLGETDATDTFDTLLTNSLVERIDTVDGARFRLLSPIRSYAFMKLIEAGEESAARERHLRNFFSFAETIRRDFDGPRAGEAAYQCETEHENFRQAVDWAIDEQAFGPEVCQLASGLTHFVNMRGHHSEWLSRIEQVLDYSDNGTEPLANARGHSAAGNFAFGAAMVERAALHFERAVELFRQDGVASNVAGSLSNYGMALMKCQRVEDAAKALEDSLATLGDAPVPGIWEPDAIRLVVQCNLAELYRYMGRESEGLPLIMQARERAEAQKRVRIMPPILLEMSRLVQNLGQTDESLTLARQAEALAESSGIPTNIADAQIVQAWCHLFKGDDDEAAATAFRSLVGARTTKSGDRVSEAFAVMGCVLAPNDPALSDRSLVTSRMVMPGLVDHFSARQREVLDAVGYFGIKVPTSGADVVEAAAESLFEELRSRFKDDLAETAGSRMVLSD